MSDNIDWEINIPQPPPAVPKPAVSAADYPLGTTATYGDIQWTVEYDEQDRQHMWVRSR
jgi:hypothetical protein